jgi:hypothetical protein
MKATNLIFSADNMYSRYMHVGITEKDFMLRHGRHEIEHLNPIFEIPLNIENMFIMKFYWTPWPESKMRKLETQMKKMEEAGEFASESLRESAESSSIDAHRLTMTSQLILFNLDGLYNLNFNFMVGANCVLTNPVCILYDPANWPRIFQESLNLGALISE